jgi:hypothetical protein
LSCFIIETTSVSSRTGCIAAAADIGDPCSVRRDAKGPFSDLAVEGMNNGPADEDAAVTVVELALAISICRTVNIDSGRALGTLLTAAATFICFEGSVAVDAQSLLSRFS